MINIAGILDRFDFTLKKYKELCRAISVSGYKVVTLKEYLQGSSDLSDKFHFLIMRHDIDRDSRYALDMAEIEFQYGIRSSYYFRKHKKTFIFWVLNKIAAYGHEIGYHYETLDKCNGNVALAQNMFEKELSDFRKNYEIKTVCAHGNPLTRFDNKDIWKYRQLSDYGLLGEAFLSIDGKKFAYYSDSGRTWLNDKKHKMPGKDELKSPYINQNIRATDDLIKIILLGEIPNIYILTHPERWSKSVSQFLIRYFIDKTFTWGKTCIYALRRV